MNQASNSKRAVGFWMLEFEDSVGFGAWDLGFLIYDDKKRELRR
jgi:hypothetical protein